jgi:hypothetical protein
VTKLFPSASRQTSGLRKTFLITYQSCISYASRREVTGDSCDTKMMSSCILIYMFCSKFYCFVILVAYLSILWCSVTCNKGKVKGKSRSHNTSSRWPKRVRVVLRPPDFLTFGTTRVVGRQPHAPAAFTPRRNPWYSFLESQSTPEHMVRSVTTEKIPSVTPPGIDPVTVRLVAQCLNHYATPGSLTYRVFLLNDLQCT